MATSSDGVSAVADVEMADPSSSRHKASPSSSPCSSSVSPRTFSIKFEFCTKSKTFAAPEVHRKLLLDAESHFPSLKINTNSNPNATISPSTSTDDYFFRHYEYKTFHKSKFSLVCVAHNITLPDSFNNLRKLLQSSLQKHHTFLRINKWSASDLDIVNVGWIYGSHYQAHNRDNIHHTLKNHCDLHNISLPDLELFPKAVSITSAKKKFTTQAIHFACRRADVDSAREALQQSFSSDSVFLPGVFIPSNLGAKQGYDTLAQFIQNQNQYLDNHRSIVLSGLTLADLTRSVSIDNITTTILNEISRSPLITWLSTTLQTMSHGKFLLSTTSEHYSAALKWLDNEIMPLLLNMDEWSSPPQYLGSGPCRLGRKSPHSDDYVKSLASSVSPMSDTTYTRPPNAWKRPISIVASKTAQTTVSKITSTPSATITKMEQQIQHLTDLVTNLQQQLKETQASQTTVIQEAVHASMQKQHNQVAQQYSEMLKSADAHWKKITSSFKCCNAPVATTAPVEDATPERHSRPPDPGPPARAPKLSKYSHDAIHSVQRSLTSLLPTKAPDPITQEPLMSPRSHSHHE